MVQILITFDLRPGVEPEYSQFVAQVGMPFWRQRSGIRSVSGLRNLLGASPQIVSQVECDDLEAAAAALSSPEYHAVLEQQARFVTGRTVWLLAPTGRIQDQAL